MLRVVKQGLNRAFARNARKIIARSKPGFFVEKHIFQKSALTVTAILMVFSISIVAITACSREKDPGEVPQYEEHGYDVHPLVSGETSFESSGPVLLTAGQPGLTLSDKTGVSINSIGDDDSFNLTLERSNNDIEFNGMDLESTGSKRLLRLEDINFEGSEDDFYSLSAQISIPAFEKGEIDIDTINIARIGDVIENGEIVKNAIRYLPATLDGNGNVTATDIYLPDTVLSYYIDSVGAQGITSINQTIESIASNLLAQNDYKNASYLNRAQQASPEISYSIITFQSSINWSRRPHLVRMVPDKEANDRRIPIDQLTATQRQAEMEKPVQNVFVFVHGRNEAEKEGVALNDIDAPWFYSYKRDVWTHMYDTFLDEYEDKLGCTLFFEFIYPTFRPIFTPVAGEGNRTTLDKDFNRALEMALKDQLDNNLDFNLIIVAHSMGGLVSRAGVQHFGPKLDSAFKNLITWGTPHHGSPLVTLRYALGATGTVYRMGYLPQMNFLYYQLRKTMNEFTIDTPGTMDLRWDGGPQDLPVRLSLQSLFVERFDQNEPLVVDMYNLENGDFLYSRNLNLLNNNDRYRNDNKYIFMYGVTTKTAVSGFKTVRIPGRSTEITLPIPETDLSEIALGNFMMNFLLQEPDLMYQGYPMDNSDGAVPIVSMAGGTMSGLRFSLGDIDHEEYFGAPSGPSGLPHAFTGLGSAKATHTAQETYRLIGLGSVEDYNCPEIEMVDPLEDGTLVIQAAGSDSGSIDLTQAENAKVTGRLNWPGDEEPGHRIKPESGIEIVIEDKLIHIKEMEIEQDGTFKLFLRPEQLLGQSTIQENADPEIVMTITLIFKDDTRLSSEEISLDISFETAGLRIDPRIVSAEPGALVDFTLTIENYDDPVSFTWDFGDGSTEFSSDELTAEHIFGDDKEQYTVTVRMHERDNPNVVIATATALVYVAEGEDEPAQPTVDHLALLHEFSEMRVLLRSNDDYRIWTETSGETTETRTGYTGTQKRIPFVTVGSIENMPITWEGTTFTGIIEWGDLSSNGRLEEVTGTVSADGTFIERMVYTYTYRSTTSSGNIIRDRSAYWEYVNIPIPWPSFNPDRASTLRYELRGEDISQHVVALEHHSESSTGGVMTTSATYVTTHWNDEAAFFLWLYK